MFHYIRRRQVQQKTGQNLGGLHIHNINPPNFKCFGGGFLEISRHKSKHKGFFFTNIPISYISYDILYQTPYKLTPSRKSMVIFLELTTIVDSAYITAYSVLLLHLTSSYINPYYSYIRNFVFLSVKNAPQTKMSTYN